MGTAHHRMRRHPTTLHLDRINHMMGIMATGMETRHHNNIHNISSHIIRNNNISSRLNSDSQIQLPLLTADLTILINLIIACRLMNQIVSKHHLLIPPKSDSNLLPLCLNNNSSSNRINSNNRSLLL
jgi:hypothetical protein